jgi:acyl-coenzyme A thioesterase PaaI-like protein
VTTDATVHFLRGARPGRLLACARVLKDGKRLVVGDVVVMQDGAGAGADDAPLVHAVMTYSVPPVRP